MAQLLVNKVSLENSVKRIVKQSFPFATPSELVLEVVDKGLRRNRILKIPGKKERCSRLGTPVGVQNKLPIIVLAISLMEKSRGRPQKTSE